MLGRFSNLFVVLALSVTLGLHWMLLQSVAWMGMIVSYSQTDGLPHALVKTFKGKHPCQLCKVVQEGKQSEKKQETVTPGKKLEFFLADIDVRLPSRPSPDRVRPFVVRTIVRTEQPPVPPPRLA